jgi:hypothetical protein
MLRRTAILSCLLAGLLLGCRQSDEPPSAADVDSAAAPGEPPRSDRLGKPVPIEADGKGIKSDVYSFVPFLGDLDGDGRNDLLLGTRDKGRLLVYRNEGDNKRPRLAAPTWFDDAVPTGRIPSG